LILTHGWRSELRSTNKWELWKNGDKDERSSVVVVDEGGEDAMLK
jgi:hypothetical protein